MIDLTKPEKKLARELIEKGLQKEFAKGLQAADSVLQKWKNKGLDNREAYHTLYKKITNFDKHIARRYDAMSGSRYLLVILGQLQDGVISEDDLEGFSEQIKGSLKYMLQ